MGQLLEKADDILAEHLHAAAMARCMNLGNQTTKHHEQDIKRTALLRPYSTRYQDKSTTLCALDNI